MKEMTSQQLLDVNGGGFLSLGDLETLGICGLAAAGLTAGQVFVVVGAYIGVKNAATDAAYTSYCKIVTRGGKKYAVKYDGNPGF